MSYTRDELNFFGRNKEEIDSVCAQLGLRKSSAVADGALVREAFGSYGRAVIELATARSSTTGKLPQQWWMCHDSAQQATPLAVAYQRALRIGKLLGAGEAPAVAGSGGAGLVYDATCSIGTEGYALQAAGVGYVGGDLDDSRLRMARHNLGDDARLVRADAVNPAITDAAVVVADPGRRAGGRRIVKPEDLIPPLPAVIETWGRSAELAIKCAPGLDFSAWEGLVSVASVDGGVKEACLYSEGLSAGRRREAIMLKAHAHGEVVPGLSQRYACDRVDDSMPDDAGVGEVGTYILDPDGAVVRAGLVRHYACREGLWMLDEHIAYLTGDHLPEGTSGFRFIEMVPVKKLKQALRAHDAGSVEILVRGVDVDPDQLRKKLSLKGKAQLAVVIARIGSQAQAYICHKREFATARQGY